MEIIIFGDSNVYPHLLKYGFSGSWRLDSQCLDYIQTFIEITGIDVLSEQYAQGGIIKGEEFFQCFTNRVSNPERFLDMYRLKEWLRLAIDLQANLAVLP